MPNFRRTTNSEVTGIINLVQGNSLRLKLDGIVKGSKATHYLVQSSSPLITVSQRPNEKQREQLITLNVSHTGTAKLLTISASNPDNNSVVASFRVNILPKLTLPDFGSEVGIVAHLLLAESLTPDYKTDYGDGEDVFRAMELMRDVLDNRLAAAKTSGALRSYVACNPPTMDLKGIVQANLCGRTIAPQFDGFDGARSTPHQDKLGVINHILSQANDGTHSNFEKSRLHIEKAVEVAARPVSTTTISDAALLFWKTARSDPPSFYAIQKRILAGQVFFSLSNSYLKNPQNPGRP